jgi:uracil phosphoribosyltransferase
MAATGSSVSYVLDVYRRLPGGRPRKLVMCHLIVTPEYLLRVAKDAPDVVVYALRLDRGRSSEDVLATVPGTRWAEERGLDDDGYILPGAGGIGEVLNNAWV